MMRVVPQVDEEPHGVRAVGCLQQNPQLRVTFRNFGVVAQNRGGQNGIRRVGVFQEDPIGAVECFFIVPHTLR